MTRTSGNHCAFCGELFAADMPWPRLCGRCQGVTEIGLITLVTVLDRRDGLLLCRSEHPLHASPGSYLPAAFLDFGETWRQTASRILGRKCRFQSAGAISDPEGIPRLYARCLDEDLVPGDGFHRADENGLSDPTDRTFIEQGRSSMT